MANGFLELGGMGRDGGIKRGKESGKGQLDIGVLLFLLTGNKPYFRSSRAR